MLEVGVVVVVPDALAVLDPFVASCHRVEAPVDEHPEARFVQPPEVLR